MAIPDNTMSVVLVAIFGATLPGEKLAGANRLGILLIAAGAFLVAHKP